MSPCLRKLAAVGAAVLCSASIAHAEGEAPARQLAYLAPASQPAEPPPEAEPRPHDDQVLLGGKLEHGGFGGPEVKVTSMTSHAVVLVGGQGGWLVNHSLIVGGAGYGLASQLEAPSEAYAGPNKAYLRGGYGGLRLGYVVMPHSLVHGAFGALLGGGAMVVGEREGDTEHHLSTQTFFAIEPQAELEINLSRLVRVGIAASYRYIDGVDAYGLSRASLSGPAGGLLFKFGQF